MRTSTAFGEFGYRVDDGDIGYAGDTHLSFEARPVPHVAHIRVSAEGDAALALIYGVLSARGERQNVSRNRNLEEHRRFIRGKRHFPQTQTTQVSNDSFEFHTTEAANLRARIAVGFAEADIELDESESSAPVIAMHLAVGLDAGEHALNVRGRGAVARKRHEFHSGGKA